MNEECSHDWEFGVVRQLTGWPFAKKCKNCNAIEILESPYNDRSKLTVIKALKKKEYISFGFFIGSILSSIIWLILRRYLG